MLIRPKDWWPTAHVPEALSKSDETKVVDWVKTLVNTKTRYVRSQELREAMRSDMEAIVGKKAALSARDLNNIIRRANKELRAEETPLPEPDPMEI